MLSALPEYDEATVMSLSDTLRSQGHSPELVSAALTQSKLRLKARDKFGPFAASMLFTSAGLEQATRLVVAARHASRYDKAGVKHVADLGCGIGADAMAFAGMDINVLAVDANETTAAVATMNLRHFPHASVHHGDVTVLDMGELADAGIDGLYFDPARRTSSGKRVFDPYRASPPLDFIESCADKIDATGVKVAPGIDHDIIDDRWQAEWVSVDGDLVEAGLWHGPLKIPGVKRSALLLSTTSGIPAFHVWDAGMPDTPVGDVGEFLYEPDDALIRSGLIGQAAADIGARLVDPTIAYLTTDDDRPTPLATQYRVRNVMPFSVKRLKSYVKEHGIGIATIKKRGVSTTPEQLRPQLNLKGDNEATIVMTRVAGKHTAIICDHIGRGLPTQLSAS